MKQLNRQSTQTLAFTALLVAIMVVMTLLPFLGYIPLGPVNATLMHIPVMIGAILLGPKIGAFLGFFFGLTSLYTNTVRPGLTSFVFSPFYSIDGMEGNFLSLIVCFVPRILIGIVAYYVFISLRRIVKNRGGSILPLACAGVLGSLTNTVFVMSGIYLFFGKQYATVKAMDVSLLFKFILGVVGTNGVPEAIVAGILVAAVCGVLLKLRKKQQP
ncbi:MAG: ECF transporter S component [Oscillospiraceae bacterium]|jgi:uncharacterized membrane protein|nr:ECF transporter S component [Oscillospiraceae bacterium]